MSKLIVPLLFVVSGLLNADSAALEKQRALLISGQMSAEQSHLWPTLDWKSTPLIVTFDNGHIYAFNMESEDTGWEKMPIGKKSVLFAKKDLWGLTKVHMQSEFDIEGKKAFVYHMVLSDSPLHDVTILAHERFHRHQGENFEMHEGQGVSLDHLSEENLTWGEIEDQLLREFLDSPNDEKIERIKDFVAVNSMRRDAIDPKTKQWENGQLRMEGMADYVSTKAYGGEHLLLSMHPKEDHDNDFIDEAIKWRHYMAGAAIGYALDLLGVAGWQTQIQEGEALPDLLGKAMPLTQGERDKRIKKVQLRLNYKKKRRLIMDKIDRYQKRVNALHRDYEQESGIKLFLGHPRTGISGGGANDEMVYIDNGSVLALNDSSVATTSDGNWKFETKKISHLFQHARGEREVKIAAVARITMDQIAFAAHELLQEPREYPFKNLTIDCEGSSLDSKEHQGVLVVDEEGLHIRYI